MTPPAHTHYQHVACPRTCPANPYWNEPRHRRSHKTVLPIVLVGLAILVMVAIITSVGVSLMT